MSWLLLILIVSMHGSTMKSVCNFLYNINLLAPELFFNFSTLCI